MSYPQDYQYSISHPESFWREQAKKIKWFKEPKKILTKDANQVDRWFADGELNTAFLALDYHVLNGRAEQVALIYDSPVSRTKQQFTYRQLTEEVARCAGALKTLGVSKGDRVIIYMPMIPQATIAMLACARLGAVHSVVFGGFAARELAVRIDDAAPKIIMTASCGIEVDRVINYKVIVDEAISLAKNKPSHTLEIGRAHV